MIIQSHTRNLDNGLRLVCVPQPHLHTCEVACYVGVGSRHESGPVSGISHFLEHLLFRGTEEYADSLLLEQAFEALGGSANALTDAESTCFFSRLHPDCLAPGLGLFASMLQRPLLRDVEIERKIIQEEAEEDYNERGELINPDVLMAGLLWPGSSLAMPTIGTRSSVAGIDAARLAQHHREHYVPFNTVLTATGKVDPEHFFSAAADQFSAWRGGLPPAAVPFSGRPSDQRCTWVADATSQVSVQLAFAIPGRDEVDRVQQLRLLRRVLSGGVTSRLMLRLRETLGLTYNIEANISMLEETGCFSIDFMVVPDNLVEAVREVLSVLEELLAGPIPEDELQRVVQSYLYDLDFSCDQPDEMAFRYGWGELVGFVRDVSADRRDIAAASGEQVLQAARACLLPANLRGVFVGPFRDGQRPDVEAALAAYGSGLS